MLCFLILKTCFYLTALIVGPTVIVVNVVALDVESGFVGIAEGQASGIGHVVSFCVGLLDLCQQLRTFLLARAMDGVADDALLIDHDGEGEALGANPRHHVLCLDKVRPCEVVFVGYPLG